MQCPKDVQIHYHKLFIIYVFKFGLISCSDIQHKLNKENFQTDKILDVYTLINH